MVERVPVEDETEERAAGEPGRIPERGRTIVGDSCKGASHPGGADADGRFGLGPRRGAPRRRRSGGTGRRRPRSGRIRPAYPNYSLSLTACITWAVRFRNFCDGSVVLRVVQSAVPEHAQRISIRDMTMNTAAAAGATPAPKGLLARFIGIITAPQRHLPSVVAHPKWFGMLALTTVHRRVLLRAADDHRGGPAGGASISRSSR